MGQVLQGEPSLDEILAEPIVQLLMHRDRVRMEDLTDLANRLRPTLRGKACCHWQSSGCSKSTPGRQTDP